MICNFILYMHYYIRWKIIWNTLAEVSVLEKFILPKASVGCKVYCVVAAEGEFSCISLIFCDIPPRSSSCFPIWILLVQRKFDYITIKSHRRDFNFILL